MIAVFDIGKTNKKFFLFTPELEEVSHEYIQLDELTDDDGFPCDDLVRLTAWMQECLKNACLTYQINAINFSAYGASLVHLDEAGQPVLPFFNYLKPFPEHLLQQFLQQYGPEAQWSQETASPLMGLLNSGLQWYYLKYAKPKHYQRIRQSLHFPQYLSYVFSETAVSGITSVGCHTGMWDYSTNAYHHWIHQEGFDQLTSLPQAQPFSTARQIHGREVEVGMGVHDSSAALLPYLFSREEPFLLISTGTWSITMNPFSEQALTEEDLHQDCLNFLRYDGKPVRAARLFLGHEFKQQVTALHEVYHLAYGVHRTQPFQKDLYLRAKKRTYQFHFSDLKRDEQPAETSYQAFEGFEDAYHQLVLELVELQINAIKLAAGESNIRQICVDGGFVHNHVFLETLKAELPDYEFLASESPLGSAFGAALLMVPEDQRATIAKQHLFLQSV